MDVLTFEGEQVLAAWNGVTLTSERVVYSWVQGGREGVESIQLHQLQHTSFRAVHALWALVVGGLGALVALFGFGPADSPELAVVAGFCALVLFLYYLLSRRIELRVGAGLGQIRCRVNGGRAAVRNALTFLAAVDRAASQRG